MPEVALIVAGFFILARQLGQLDQGSGNQLATKKLSPRLIQMGEYADRLFAERKWLAAEKAYLSVLKQNHKDVTAYSHLGIIYSTQKNLPDAIECFQMAVKLKPSGASYQNLGLAYYENRNYIKSVAAFEKAIMFEPSVPRLVGLSKAQRKLSNIDGTIQALESAAEIDPTKRVLMMLAETYETAGRKDDSTAVYRKIHELDPADPEAARKVGIHLPGKARSS